MSDHRLTRVAIAMGVFVGLASPAVAADPYRDKVIPFLTTYCVSCHKADKKSGELDLTRFDTASKILDDFRQWEHVVTFMKKGEMPPAKAKQPSPELRAEMVATLEQVLATEARKLSGDPGVVPPRRLTNAEYDYTIRDLMGVDINPAKAFPVDPASGEGFNNTGEALTMSPSLFKKYLGAAEQVAEHAVLTTEGLRFAPHPVVAFADRQKFYEQQIIRFYESHAVDYEKMLTALWLYKHRTPAEKGMTLEVWATSRGLSPKYARLLWDALERKSDDKFFLAWLRDRWAKFPASQTTEPKANEVQAAARSLANEIKQLSPQLTPKETEAIVSNAGNAPIDHLARRRRTAETRDTFDSSTLTLSGQRLQVEYRNLERSPTIKLVIQVGDVGVVKADGYVVVKGMFTTNAPTSDNRNKWTLREVLSRHAPETFEKLKFGVNLDPMGEKIDDDAFVVKGPTTLEIELPRRAFPLAGKGNVTLNAEYRLSRGTPGVAAVQISDRMTQGLLPVRPMIDPKHPSATAVATSATAFCRLFPNRFYYVDNDRGLSAGFHLIEGFFRDDQPLCRSVLSDAENAELDRLWRELYFVTGIWEKMLRGFVFFERSERNFLKHPDFDPFKEEDPFLTSDQTLARFQAVYLKRSNVKTTGDALANHPITVFFTDVRQGLMGHASALKKAESLYLRDLLTLAERAYRRPLTTAEKQKLESTYAEICRDPDHGTEAAVRATLARILVSPHFLMRFELTPSGDTVAPLPDLALASRLSYFLWSGPPDAELLALAAAGKLHDEKILRAQVRRMLKDPKVSRFALEFFGQWLGHRRFLTEESVNRQVFPTFDDALRQAMFEEPTRLITDLIQRNRPITELLDGDTTFVNKKLAGHYGLPFNGAADEWQEVKGLRDKGRGGLMGMAVFLTKNSQPQRTSPVKRGFWVVHKVLGEHIPPPPPDVAVLPAKETDTAGKTIRDLLKLHVADAKCASCHQRFDPVGLSMEGFDPIGRTRSKDLAGRPIDNAVSLPSGNTAHGVPEFGAYLASSRKAEFAHTLCQKFLGYALGRSVQLSDRPLLDEMETALARDGYKLSTLFEIVATSPQFRTQRCQDFSPGKFQSVNTPGGRK